MNRAQLGAVIILGGFFGMGTANAVASAFTGTSLFSAPGAETSQQAAAEAPAEQQITGTWTKPINAPVTTAYKARGGQWASGFHTGVDMAASTGTPVYAVSAGKVVTAGWGGAYGNNIVIEHRPGTYSHYAHLSRLLVSVGQQVKTGAKIGLVGATGTKSSGPHLHFEMRTGTVYGTDVDPVKALRPRGVTL